MVIKKLLRMSTSTPYNPEWNKMAGSPYASLATYYKLPPKPRNVKKSDLSPEVAVPVFGGVGYNEKIRKLDPTVNQCHAWRVGDYDGRVLSKNAYPQCGPGSACDQYASRY